MTSDLIDAALPVLAVGMARSAAAMLGEWGVGVRRDDRRPMGRKGIYAQTKASAWLKSTTATDYLERNPDSLVALADAVRSSGVSGWRIITEIPRPMLRRLARALAYTFKQDYWRAIAETTAGDAEVVLRRGAREGRSIRQMAADMEESLGGDYYATVRAKNIARTESGWALNRARTQEMEALQEDVPELKMRPTWRSVLGTTTRASHAHLDGVPADERGTWLLGGVRIRAPGDPRLPGGERCNCQCSVVMEFGMDDDSARQAIREYYERSGEG